MTGPAGPGRWRWRDPVVVAVALLALASGMGQFGVVAALGDVAKSFGHLAPGKTFADQAGLNATQLGAGLGLIRLASLGGLGAAVVADRVGRRPVLLWASVVGLVLTVLAAGSPGYWWFVAAFALGRPFLSATNALAQVSAAELTSSADRAKAVALVAAGYAVGTGITSVAHGLLESTIGFRGVFALSAIPLLALPLVARRVVETERFLEEGGRRHGAAPGSGVGPWRVRLLKVCVLVFAVALVTGPANSLFFIYAENVEHVAPAFTSVLVLAAGVVGLGGLLAGRFVADRVGRRPTCAGCMVAIVGFGLLTYSGGRTSLVVGYELQVLAAATFAPAAGAFSNELFPTAVRASAAGWQVVAAVLGAVVGLLGFAAVAGEASAGRAAEVTFLPALAAVAMFLALPETRGREPEELWATSDG